MSLFEVVKRLDGFGASAGGRDEDVFDQQVEQLGDTERERQRRIIFAGLDRIDALTRDFEPFGEVLLAPAALSAEHAESVFHQQPEPVSPNLSLLARPPTPRPKNQMIATQ